jgi:hypothetical protein
LQTKIKNHLKLFSIFTKFKTKTLPMHISTVTQSEGKMRRFLTLILLLLFSFLVYSQESNLYFTVRQRVGSTLIGKDIDIKGLYRGSYRDTTWQHLGWKNNIVWSIGIDTASRGKNIFLGCLNGVLRSRDFGKTWKVMTDWRVSDVLGVTIDPFDSRVIYANMPMGVFRSDDGGETWKEKNKGLKPTNQTFVSCLLIDKKLPKHLFAGTAGGVIFSKNAGNSWQTLGLEGIEIHCIAQNLINASHLLCGTEDKGIYQTTDKGKTWQLISSKLSAETIYTIAFRPANPQIIYSGGHQTGILKSENGGQSWQSLTNELSGKSIRKICLSSQNPSLIFVACFNGGVFKSEDGGNHFVCIGECNAQIWDIFLEE